MGWISMIQPVLWESRISNISGRLLTSILVSRYAPGRVGRHTIQHIYVIIFIIFNLRHRVFLFFVFDYPIKHPLCAPIALPIVSLVVFVAAHFPEVRFHRFLASGGVFLRLEIDLVLGNLREIRLTGFDSRCHGAEACACIEFAGRERGAAFHFLTQEKTVTIRVFRSCYTVGTKQHLVTAVLRAGSRFTQCAGYAVNTGTPFYFCHFARAILVRVWKPYDFKGSTRMLSLSDPQN